MKRWSWMVAATVLLALGCGKGVTGDKQVKTDPASRKAEWTWIEGAKKKLDAKREELASLRQQANSGADVAASLNKINEEITQDSDELGRRLADYINVDPPVPGQPMSPDQLASVRLKSSEDMAIASEYIELGGDYRRALDIYNSALAIDPDNAELKAAISDAEAKRFMSLERFGAVKKGMTEGDVITRLGRPLMRNIREYPEKKVVAWFYPKNDEGEAAGVFFNDKKLVYSTEWSAVKRTDAH